MCGSTASEQAAESATEYDIDALKNQPQLSRRKPADPFIEHHAVQCQDLGYVGHGLFHQPALARREPDVTRGIRPAQVAGKGHADHGCDATAIEGITLHHNHGAPKAGR